MRVLRPIHLVIAVLANLLAPLPSAHGEEETETFTYNGIRAGVKLVDGEAIYHQLFTPDGGFRQDTGADPLIEWYVAAVGLAWAVNETRFCDVYYDRPISTTDLDN